MSTLASKGIVWRAFAGLLVTALSVSILAGAENGGNKAPDRDKATEAARKAFAASPRMPWYDSKNDAFQAIRLPNRSNRSAFDWLAQPVLWPSVVGITLILAFLAWRIVQALLERKRARTSSKSSSTEPVVAADAIEALPFLRERSRDDLLGQARRYYEQGNYAEAIIYLFSHELVELDRQALVHLVAGKTNRQYMREISKWQPLSRLVEQTMLAFEGVFFGGHALDRAGFEVCWNRLGDFENLMTQAQVAS